MEKIKSNNQDMVKKAYVYVRVSSEEQVTNFSLENQTDYCKREAERQGFEVVKVYREEGASAKTTNRPQLIQVLNDCKTNQSEISAIFIYKIDRISRDTFDFLVIKKKLAQYGIRIISVTEPVEDSPTGEFLETLLAAVAKLDNSMKSQRTLDGMRKRVEAGYLLGKAPPGYINVTKNEIQVVEPDEQAEKMQKAWEEMGSGAYSLETIIPIMNKLGIVIKRGEERIPITRNQQTQRIFRDKTYAGYVVSDKFKIDKIGRHKALIDEDLFYKVQAIIDGRSFTSGLSYKRQHPDFSLRGQVLCSKCGNSMTGSWSKGRHAKYAYYFCLKCKPSPSLPKDNFEEEFVKFVKSIEPNKELVSLFSAMVKERWQERYHHIDERQKQIEEELEALVELRDRLAEKNLKGLYSDELFAEQLTKIEHEILVKKSLKSETKLEKVDIDIVVEFMNNFLWNITKAWKDGDLQQRKILTGSIFPEKVIYEYPGFRTATLGPCFNLINQFNGSTTSLGVP